MSYTLSIWYMTEWIAYGASMKTWHPPYIRPLPQPNLLFNHFPSLLNNHTLTPWLYILITYSIIYHVPSNYFSYLPANLNLLLVSYPGCWRWRANWVNERHPLLNAHIRPTSDAGTSTTTSTIFPSEAGPQLCPPMQMCNTLIVPHRMPDLQLCPPVLW